MEKAIYHVVLTGELVDGFQREAVVAGLARLFQIPSEQIARVLDAGAYPIEGYFDADEVIELQARLARIGAHARAERVVEDPDLGGEIAPHLRLPAAPDAAPPAGAEPVAPAPSGRPAPMRPVAQPRPGRPDIHALENRRLRDDWIDEDQAEPTEEDRIELFMGADAAHLFEPCKRMKIGWRTRLRLTWAGGAVLSPFLWAMYRKMWAWGLVIFVTEILLPIILITWGARAGVSDWFAWFGVALLVLNRVFWPMVLKWLYCRHTRKAILRLNRMAPTFAPDIDIAAKGGRSRTSAFVGIVLAIVVSMLTWTIVDGVYDWSSAASTPLPVLEERAPSGGSRARGQASTAVQGVTENKWVQTRGRLRDVGRGLSAWFDGAGRDRPPASLTTEEVAGLLQLESAQWLDGWGQRIRYEGQEAGFSLLSAGPDGEFGTADDIAYRRMTGP